MPPALVRGAVCVSRRRFRCRRVSRSKYRPTSRVWKRATSNVPNRRRMRLRAANALMFNSRANAATVMVAAVLVTATMGVFAARGVFAGAVLTGAVLAARGVLVLRDILVFHHLIGGTIPVPMSNIYARARGKSTIKSAWHPCSYACMADMQILLGCGAIRAVHISKKCK